MARCGDCNKFVGLEMEDPEVNSLEVDADGNVTAEVTIKRNCADCGTELKTAELSMEGDFSEACAGHLSGDNKEGEEETHELEIEEGHVEGTERSEGRKDKAGKPLPTPSRYTRSFFGATVGFTITCKCGKLGEDGKGIEGEVSDDIQASAMDEV